MRKLLILLSALLASSGAFALEGFVCAAEESDRVFNISIVDDKTAAIEESSEGETVSSVVEYRRILIDGGERPVRGMTTFYLEGNRNLDVIENYGEVRGIILLRNFQLEMYDCEAFY